MKVEFMEVYAFGVRYAQFSQPTMDVKLFMKARLVLQNIQIFKPTSKRCIHLTANIAIWFVRQ